MRGSFPSSRVTQLLHRLHYNPGYPARRRNPLHLEWRSRTRVYPVFPVYPVYFIKFLNGLGRLGRLVRMGRLDEGEIMARRLACLVLAAILLAGGSVAAQQPYVLGPEDVIEITVYGQPDLTRTVTILPDGTIALPLIGIIPAAGMSPDELTQTVVRAYARYIRNPRVAIIVKEFRRIRVSLLGQVVRPGIYELRPGATVLDALSAAGGLTESASVAEARLIRASGESQPLFLEDLLVRQDMQHNVVLQPADALLVPQDLNSRFYILGDANKPGVYSLRGDVSIMQALAMAGGPVQRGAATSRTIYIVRRSGAAPNLPSNYTKVEKLANNSLMITVNLQGVMQHGDLSGDIAVRPGDIIVIPQSGFINVSSVISLLTGLAIILK